MLHLSIHRGRLKSPTLSSFGVSSEPKGNLALSHSFSQHLGHPKSPVRQCFAVGVVPTKALRCGLGSVLQ